MRDWIHSIVEFFMRPSTGYGVGGGTAATEVVRWFNWLPDDISKPAAAVGLVLSCVLIYAHIKRLAWEAEDRARRIAAEDRARRRAAEEAGQND